MFVGRPKEEMEKEIKTKLRKIELNFHASFGMGKE